ncbi:unnamed protein product, partial [Lampetra fluviatilis]
MGADDEESATALFTAGPGVWLGTPSPECNADPAGFRGTRAPSSSNAAICGGHCRQAVLSVKATPASRTADRSADGETNVQCRHGCITPTPPPVRRERTTQKAREGRGTADEEEQDGGGKKPRGGGGGGGVRVGTSGQPRETRRRLERAADTLEVGGVGGVRGVAEKVDRAREEVTLGCGHLLDSNPCSRQALVGTHPRGQPGSTQLSFR